MADLEAVVRRNIVPDIAPPRKSGAAACDDETSTGTSATVVLQLGKGANGQVFTYSYKIDVTKYMEKQQRELTDSQDA